jgi:hypothetical protein
MKKYLITGGAWLLAVTLYAQQATTPNGQVQQRRQVLQPGSQQREVLQPGLRQRDQLAPGVITASNQPNPTASALRTNIFNIEGVSTSSVTGLGENNPAGTNNFGSQATNRFSNGGFTNQSGGATQIHIQVVTVSDQPIATQVQQVLSSETVLAQTLPLITININSGTVALNGNVQCGAEGVLIQNLIQQRVPNVRRIDNQLRISGGPPIAPAGFSR